MLSIDEVIAKYKEITNTDAICPAHYNISCDKCVQESEQLVDWLEELKTYRECNVCEYNKALDDFVKKINESNQGHWRPTRYEHGEVVSETMSYDIGTIRLIAEQLKAGITND